MYKKYNKYNNKKTVIDGMTFDSKKEAQRYAELKLLEKASEIQDLQLQVKFELVPKQQDERAVHYIADFMYFDKNSNETVVEDVKGVKTKDYILKRKMFKYRYPNLIFREI